MGRTKREFDEQKRVEDFVEEKWDVKKIIIGALVVGVIITGVYYGGTYALANIVNPSVLGIFEQTPQNPKTQEEVKKQSEKLIEGSKDDVNKIINQIKKDVERLTSENLDDSTGKIQDIIEDLQALQGKKKEPKDIICEYMCKKN